MSAERLPLMATVSPTAIHASEDGGRPCESSIGGSNLVERNDTPRGQRGFWCSLRRGWRSPLCILDRPESWAAAQFCSSELDASSCSCDWMGSPCPRRATECCHQGDAIHFTMKFAAIAEAKGFQASLCRVPELSAAARSAASRDGRGMSD